MNQIMIQCLANNNDIKHVSLDLSESLGRHQHTTHLVIAAHAPDRAEIICCRIEYQREGGETNSSNIDPFKSLLCFPGQDESFKRFYSINYTSTHKNSKTLHHGEIITHSFAGAGSGVREN